MPLYLLSKSVRDHGFKVVLTGEGGAVMAYALRPDNAGIPVAHVEQMREALKAAGNTVSNIVLYDGAPHAFYADYRPSYRKEEAEDGWKRMLEWFAKIPT